MKSKVLVLCKSFLWSFAVLLFPITSGVISVILSLDTVEILFLQGTFMLIALVPPIFLVLSGKWNWQMIGLAKFDFEGCKKSLFFCPTFVIFIPVAIQGLAIESWDYVLGSLFLHLFVGIAEEIYFRGIIPYYLKKEFLIKETVFLSTLIFGIGHLAIAFNGTNVFEIVLAVLNAFIFGWLAMEITILSANIIPAIFIHFFFDFETKIVVMRGSQLLIAESVRGMLMVILAIWLAMVISKGKELKSKFQFVE